MLEIQRIRKAPETIIEGLKKRGFDATETVNTLIELDAKRRSIRHDLEEKQHQSNELAKEIGILYKSGRDNEANALKAQTAGLKEAIKELNEQVQAVTDSEHELLLSLPNVPHDSVKTGKDENDNEEVSREGDIPSLVSMHSRTGNWPKSITSSTLSWG